MTCDYTVKSNSEFSGNIRCGEETNEEYINVNIGHWKNYPLDLCKFHKKLIKDVDEEMLDMNHELLEPHVPLSSVVEFKSSLGYYEYHKDEPHYQDHWYQLTEKDGKLIFTYVLLTELVFGVTEEWIA